MARPPAPRADTHPTMRTPIGGRPYRSDPSKCNNNNDNNNNMRTKRGGQHGPRIHTTRPHRQGTTTNMDTCPVLKRTHGSEYRTPHQSSTTYILALDPSTPLIVDTCRFRACAPTRTSEPCPNLGLDLWCRGTCVSLLVKLRRYLWGISIQLLIRLMCVISQQMAIFLYFYSECVIEPQH